jgi:hypothetical protein
MNTTYKPGYYRVSVAGKAAESGATVGTTPIEKSKTGELKDKNGKNVSVTIAAVANKTYTGKQIKPKLSVKSANKTLKLGTDYTVTYGKNKNIGKGTATIKGKSSYSGSIAIKFNIIPKKLSAPKLSSGKKQLKVTWKAAAAAQKISKYQVQYRIKGTSKWTTKTVGKKTSYTIKNLKPGKKYQVKVQSYKIVSGKKYYSLWSAVKTSKNIK